MSTYIPNTADRYTTWDTTVCLYLITTITLYLMYRS